MKVKNVFVMLVFLTILIGFAYTQEPGDVNSDGVINIIDALLTVQYYVGLNPQPFNPYAADVSGCDGTIDILDALLIAQYSVGLIDRFPCDESSDDGFTIEYNRSGGIAGIIENITLQSADKIIILNDQRNDLTDDEINRIWDILQNGIDFSSLPHDTAECCCDLFMYDIRISSGVSSVNGTAEWTDCTGTDGLVPQELLDLVTLITELANQGGVEILVSEIERNTNPEPGDGDLESVVTGNNMFAFDCYNAIKAQDENIFFSPVSISFAFAMCYAGANGNTEAEMASTMHFTLPEEEMHNAFNALEITLTSIPYNPPPEAGEELILHIVNSTWGQRDYYFVPEFLDILAYHYGAGMNLVDFMTEPEICRQLINDWVSEETEERITDLLPAGSIDTLTRLVLTNAIYFKANWRDPFNEADTFDGTFSLLDGSGINVPMMHQVTMTPYFEVPGEYCAVKLPYQGVKHNSMIIILPEEGQFTAVENKFTLQALETINQGMTTYQVELTMPRFSYEWEDSLKNTLIGLGMADAFTGGIADFSGINGEYNLVITDVFHKAFIAVDEIGTEAAAATAIVIGETAVPESAVMTIDRPFLYVIYNDDTGTILFFGRVLEP